MTRPKRNTPSDLNSPLVSRGGCWVSTDPAGVRASSRSTLAPAVRGHVLGFRCALRGREPRDPSKVGL